MYVQRAYSRPCFLAIAVLVKVVVLLSPLLCLRSLAQILFSSLVSLQRSIYPFIPGARMLEAAKSHASLLTTTYFFTTDTPIVSIVDRSDTFSRITEIVQTTL